MSENCNIHSETAATSCRGGGLVRRFLADGSGATAIEYGLIAALIAVSMIAGAQSVGNSIGEVFQTTSNTIDNAM